MRFSILVCGTLTALLATGCVIKVRGDHGENREHGAHREHSEHKVPVATAALSGKSGNSLHGKAHFIERHGGVLVTISVEDTPPGWHAVHIHEKGDCSSDDGKSAGGHFNPGTTAHGSPHAAMHHAGDLGNMWVEADGTGHHAIFMPELTLDSGEFAVVGRGIIVHAGVDDLTSQPTGAAGGRIGCGVIGLGH